MTALTISVEDVNCNQHTVSNEGRKILLYGDGVKFIPVGDVKAAAEYVAKLSCADYEHLIRIYNLLQKELPTGNLIRVRTTKKFIECILISYDVYC